MMSGALNRETVRQYLLGRLDDQEELESRVTDDLVLNDDLSEMVDSVEDEIIEDYAEGTLDSADRKAVDEYFLRSPERREKLRFYRILQHHLEEQIEPQEIVLPAGTDRIRAAGRAPYRWGTHLLVFGQAAALLALCIVGWAYVSGVRKTQGLLQSELAQERARSASLSTEVSQLQPPIVTLTLVSDRSRGTGSQLPRLEIKPSTQRIVAEIALTAPAADSYDVRLEARRGMEPIWTAKLMPLLSSSGDARLVFDLPAKGMQPGVYSFVVSSVTGGRRYYDFDVQLAK